MRIPTIIWKQSSIKLRQRRGIIVDSNGIYIVVMPWAPGNKYIVFERDDWIGWVEGKAMIETNSFHVAKFLYEVL